MNFPGLYFISAQDLAYLFLVSPVVIFSYQLFLFHWRDITRYRFSQRYVLESPPYEEIEKVLDI